MIIKQLENPERLHGEKAYIYDNQIINIDYDDISFPIAYNNIYIVKKIEDLNDIRINVFEDKEGKKNDVLPICHSKNTYKNCMNLLVISDNNRKNIIMCILTF